MKKSEVETGVKEVIAQNSRFAVSEIKTSDPLDKFVSSFMADRLARELKRRFSEIPTTAITNELYTAIKKVSDLIDRIYVIYNA